MEYSKGSDSNLKERERILELVKQDIISTEKLLFCFEKTMLKKIVKKQLKEIKQQFKTSL